MLVDLGRVAALTLAAAAFVGACGGDDPIDPSSNELSVGGTYNTAVTVQQSSCTGTSFQQFITTVTHTPGATTLTVTHAGNSYTGTVQRNGSFAMSPKVFAGPGETHTLTISGTFSTTSIDATVSADVQRTGSPNCQYVVKWVGPKQGGGVNIIPG